MASNAEFSIDGDPFVNLGFDTLAAASFDLQLEDAPALDVRSTNYKVIAKSSNAGTIPELGDPGDAGASPTPTPGDPLTITMPAGEGAWLIQCQINGGKTTAGVTLPQFTKQRIIAVRSSEGLRCIVPSESTQYDATYGWTAALCEMIAALGSVGGPAVDHKDSVRLATAAALPLNAQVGLELVGSQVALGNIDGVAPNVGDRILVKFENAGAADPKHGIYRFTQEGIVSVLEWRMVRDDDANTAALVTTGLEVRVEEGAANIGSKWFLSTTGAIVLGTTPLLFGNTTAQPTDIIIPDLQAQAFRVREEGATLGNEHIRIDTSSNNMHLGRGSGGSTVQIVCSNNSAAFGISDQAGDELFGIGMTGAGQIEFGGQRVPTYVINLLSTQTQAWRMKDEQNRIYMNVDTSNEEIKLGNLFTNPAVIIDSDGAISLGTASATIGFLGAAAAAVQSITGALDSITDANTRAVLQSVIDLLTTFGLGTDDTT